MFATLGIHGYGTLIDTKSVLLRKSHASWDGAWSVSSTPFDVIGARSANLQAAWAQSWSTAVFDHLGTGPTSWPRVLMSCMHNWLQTNDRGGRKDPAIQRASGL